MKIKIKILVETQIIYLFKRLRQYQVIYFGRYFNPLNAELNPICHLLAL